MLRRVAIATVGLGFFLSGLAAAPRDGKDKVFSADDAKGSKGNDKDSGKKADEKAKDAKKNQLKGTPVKIVKVDAKKHILSVEHSDGKKEDLTIGEKVQFIGPRGAVSAKGIEDDRVAKGAEIRVVLDPAGKVVKEIHLPMRESAEKKPEEKGKKSAEKGADKGKEKSTK